MERVTRNWADTVFGGMWWEAWVVGGDQTQGMRGAGTGCSTIHHQEDLSSFATDTFSFRACHLFRLWSGKGSGGGGMRGWRKGWAV